MNVFGTCWQSWIKEENKRKPPYLNLSLATSKCLATGHNCYLKDVKFVYVYTHTIYKFRIPCFKRSRTFVKGIEAFIIFNTKKC